MRNTAKPILRLVPDVCILMSTLEHTGPIDHISQLADVVPTGKCKNQATIVAGIASATLKGKAEYQVHLTGHVLRTLEYKLSEWIGHRNGWTPVSVHTTMNALVAAMEEMENSGWTADIQGLRTRHALDTIVPDSYRKEPYGIDNEDRLVLCDLVAVANLEEWDTTTPTVTMLVTNDGGLQGANEYMQKQYTSFAAEGLPASVMIVLPAIAARTIKP